MLSSFASCDEHLPSYLKETVTIGKSETVRVSHLTKEQAKGARGDSVKYSCGCNKPANWYIRISASASASEGKESESG